MPQLGLDDGVGAMGLPLCTWAKQVDGWYATICCSTVADPGESVPEMGTTQPPSTLAVP
jgi:hypothetical protein